MADEQNPSPSPAPSRLKRPVAEVRAELLADADVQEQARMLQIPVAQYVEKILDYAIHPDKPAQIQILSDEELKARDPKIPTVDELKTYMEKMLSGEIVISPAHQKDGFGGADPKRDRAQAALGTAQSLQGKPVEGSAPATPITELKKGSTFKP